jgi:hypothetical protein
VKRFFILIFLLCASVPSFSQEYDTVSAENDLTATILEEDSEEEGDSQALPDSSTIHTRHAEDEILKSLKSDPALQYKEPPTIAESLWDRFWLWLKQLLGALFEGAVSTNWGRVFMYITGIALVAVLILTILRVNAFKIFYSGEGASTFKYNVLDENIHEMDFDKLIEDALMKKDYRGGVRLVFLYSLKMLSDKNLIHWDQGKTNHDYLDELKQDELRGGFNDLNLYFEYAWYGNFTINAETFAHVQQIFNVWKANLR